MSINKIKVLAVDDDPDFLWMLKQLLTTTDYALITAQSGSEAVELFKKENPTIVITDMVMPEIDGPALCRLIRESGAGRQVYILVTSVLSDSTEILKAFDSGADDFLPKTLNRTDLLARLHAGRRTLKLEEDLAKERLGIHKANAELILLNRRLQEAACTDELTGLPNRREAMRSLDEMWATSARHVLPLSCVMIDIDHFKSFNDQYGHDVGDVVLRSIAKALQKHTRLGESVYRLGGEEFLMLCPGSTAQETSQCAERIRGAIESHRVQHAGHELIATVSMGVAEKDRYTQTLDELIKIADAAMYTAKRSGRNRVCVAGVPGSEPSIQSSPKTVTPRSANDKIGTILVVDDDPISHLFYRRLLEKEGYEVHEANDGLQAINKCREIKPNVVVMDVEMPSMDGLACTRLLKHDPKTQSIPIIMVSAHSEDKDIEAGLEAEADEYIVKPIKHREFVLRIRSMERLHQNKSDLILSNTVRGEQARALEILLELSRTLTYATNLDEAFDRIITATADLTGCQRISIMLPSEDRRFLFVAKCCGMDNNLTKWVRVPVGQATAGQVFLTQQPVVINTAQEAMQQKLQYDTPFFVSTPLISKVLKTGSHVIGVLNVTERYDGRPFKPIDLEYIDLVCNIAATAINDIESRKSRDTAYNSIVVALASLAEYRDDDTGKHLDRVTAYALLLAKELRSKSFYGKQIDDEFLFNLARAVPLHDIGKVAIPDKILLKPGKLTDEEMAIMKTHVNIGSQTLDSVIQQTPNVRFLLMAREIILGHHEWYDGSGYPEKSAGEQIPLAARITALADVYDALTTSRPYKDAFSHEKAAAIIRSETGSHFAPDIVEAFIKLEKKFQVLAEELSDERSLQTDHPSQGPENSSIVDAA